jgi:hypothetical protein
VFKQGQTTTDNDNRNCEKGSTLILVLLVMVVLLLLGTTLMYINVAENRSAAKLEDKLQAYYIARSGAEALAEYMLRDEANLAKQLIGKTSDINEQVGGGSFQVSVAAGETDDVVYINSVGLYNGTSQTVKLKVTRTITGLGGIFDHAVVAKEKIDTQGAGQGVVIDGSVAIANTNTGNINLGGQGSLNGNKVYDSSLIFPAIVMPHDRDPEIVYSEEFVVVTDSLTLNTTVAGPSYYYAEGFDYGSNDVLTIAGDGIAHLYVEGDFSFLSNPKLNIASTAKLYVYIVGNHSVTMQGTGNERNNFMVYAPDSNIDWNSAGAGNIDGSIIGKTVKFHQHTKITYNPDMILNVDIDKTTVGVSFTGYTWVN